MLIRSCWKRMALSRTTGLDIGDDLVHDAVSMGASMSQMSQSAKPRGARRSWRVPGYRACGETSIVCTGCGRPSERGMETFRCSRSWVRRPINVVVRTAAIHSATHRPERSGAAARRPRRGAVAVNSSSCGRRSAERSSSPSDFALHEWLRSGPPPRRRPGARSARSARGPRRAAWCSSSIQH